MTILPVDLTWEKLKKFFSIILEIFYPSYTYSCVRARPRAKKPRYMARRITK